MAQNKLVAIDCLAESTNQFSEDTAIVVVDVIRSTTVAATIIQSGQRCFITPTVEAAFILKERLFQPLLVGEVGGNKPYGFDFGNSPVEIKDFPKSRPAILVSSSGIPLLYSLRNNRFVYVACLRNYSATVKYIAKNHNNVLVLGAPTRNEFREEDKLCCSLIASGLAELGFSYKNKKTIQLVNNWKHKPVNVCCRGNSAKYLIETGQKDDLEFIVTHIDDLDIVLRMKEDEITRMPQRVNDNE